MLEWLSANWGNIIISAVVLGIIVTILVKLLIDLRKEKTNTINCIDCPMKDSCQKRANNQNKE